MDKNEVLLREHEELVNLFIHEDNLVWNLIYFFLIINVGLISGTGALISFGVTGIILLLVSLLCLFGAVIAFSWFFTMQRSRIHWEALIFRAEDIERELQKKGLMLATFHSYVIATFYEKMKYKRKGKGELEDQEWRERVEPIQYLDIIMFLIGIAWAGSFVITFASALNILFPVNCALL